MIHARRSDGSTPLEIFLARVTQDRCRCDNACRKACVATAMGKIPSPPRSRFGTLPSRLRIIASLVGDGCPEFWDESSGSIFVAGDRTETGIEDLELALTLLEQCARRMSALYQAIPIRKIADLRLVIATSESGWLRSGRTHRVMDVPVHHLGGPEASARLLP